MDPTNPLDPIIRILVALLMALAGTGAASQPAPPPAVPPPQARPPIEGPLSRSPTIIEAVEVITLASYPYQLQLVVRGYQPDGCQAPVQVEQRREGNAVFVEIFRELPEGIICTMQIVPYSDTIRLEGAFESGAYQIYVNGQLIEITL